MRSIPGGDALFDWFGHVPHFHDGEILEITLVSIGPSRLRIHTWRMTDKVDSEGYFVLDRHIVVTITLIDVTYIALSEFYLTGIIGRFDITKIGDAYQFTWDVAYGVEGTIRAKQAEIALAPGSPESR
jgi:hypothetical protein